MICMHVAIYYLPAACKMSVDFIMSSCKGFANLPLVRIACGLLNPRLALNIHLVLQYRENIKENKKMEVMITISLPLCEPYTYHGL